MHSTSTAVSPVGLIGIGLLGSVLAERLLAGGFAVLGHDLAPARLEALREAGGTVAAGGAAEIFRRCDRVLLSLPTYSEVAALLCAHAGGLRSGLVLLDTTTGDPTTAEALARDLAGRGVAYLDATISGSSAQVRAGTAVVMAGGDRAAYAACADLLGIADMAGGLHEGRELAVGDRGARDAKGLEPYPSRRPPRFRSTDPVPTPGFGPQAQSPRLRCWPM